MCSATCVSSRRTNNVCASSSIDSPTFPPPLSRDGKTLVTGDDSREVIVWDAQAGTEQRRWKVKLWVRALDISPDGKTVMTAENFPQLKFKETDAGVRLRLPQSVSSAKRVELHFAATQAHWQTPASTCFTCRSPAIRLLAL